MPEFLYGRMMGVASLVLKNVTLPDGRVVDLSLRSGEVVHAGSGLAADQSIDCTGKLVLPAATDIHVHMRGGPQSLKEDWKTGSMSALAGGTTLVVDQPNTAPPLATPEAFSRRVEEAHLHSRCHFAINSAVTRQTPFRLMEQEGAMAFGETFFGASSYGDTIRPETLRHALTEIVRFSGLVTVHAETVRTGKDGDLLRHGEARSVAGEVEAVHAVERLNRVACRLHFCHLSSARAVDAVRASSFEVTPHHLLLSTEMFRNSADPKGKVNPPLRPDHERRDLMRLWDRIPIIASDHAPHTLAEKQGLFCDAPSGIPGVETMMPLLVKRVLDHTISPGSLIEKTSANPALLLGIKKAGFSTGDRADFAIFPKSAIRIHADDLHSRSGWTPYEGMPAVFPSKVIMNGMTVFDEGVFFPGNPLWFYGKGYRPPLSVSVTRRPK